MLNFSYGFLADIRGNQAAATTYGRDTKLHPVSRRKLEACHAMLGGSSDETGYVFLVPDEGNSAISLLHDRLYSGALVSKVRLDLEYIPHITIGCADRHHAKALCDSLNMHGVSIAGRIDELTVAAVDRDRVQKLRSFKLGARS